MNEVCYAVRDADGIHFFSHESGASHYSNYLTHFGKDNELLLVEIASMRPVDKQLTLW